MTKTKTATRPADLLIDGGRAAFSAGEGVAVANKQRASALDLLVAGLTPAMLAMEIAFDITDRAGNAVESTRASLLAYAKGFRNVDGSDNRTKQSAFRAAVLPALFGVAGDQSAGAKAAWALVTTKALPAARALEAHGISAALSDEGKLVLEGGEGEEADNLKAAAAKSTSALAKAAAGKSGTDRDGPQNDKGREATPSEVTRAAFAVAKLIAAGEATACNATLSNLREIARLVTKFADAFAED